MLITYRTLAKKATTANYTTSLTFLLLIRLAFDCNDTFFYFIYIYFEEASILINVKDDVQ